MIKRFTIKLYRPWLYILLFVSCKHHPEIYNDKFYNRVREGEHRILPIRKPYYLKSIFNEPWEINLESSKITSSNVDKLCIDKSHLWGYGKFGTTYSIYEEATKDLFTYFIIDFGSGTEYISVDSIEYQEKINELKLFDETCYPKRELDEMYSDFSKTGELPWFSEK